MNLVTDRTLEDVLSGNEKGVYAYTDLNRVEQAVANLCDLARSLDVLLQLDIKQNWQRPGAFSVEAWPVESQMQRYLGNVAEVLKGLDISAPLPRSMADLNYKGANQIEQALVLAWERIMCVTQAFQYSGEVFAGEELL